jgi:hypothetical protein
MSRSRNTQKEEVWAAERIDRHEDGEACLPRIIVRRPKRGDIHPLPKSILAGALRTIPLEYLYGLSCIELRARQGNEIGAPFGAYRPRDRVIILYSLPLSWVVSSMPEGRQKEVERFRARVSREGPQWHVRWPSEASLAVWFFAGVVTHELGHHFSEQYKNKRGRIRGARFREMNADLHSFRLTRAMFNRLRKRRETGELR